MFLLFLFCTTKIGEISDIAKCFENFVSQTLGFLTSFYAAELRYYYYYLGDIGDARGNKGKAGEGGIQAGVAKTLRTRPPHDCMNQIICVQPISQSQQNNYLKLKYFIRVSFEKDNIVVISHAQIFHSKRCLPSSRSCRLRQNIGRNAANMVSMGCQSGHNEGAE